MIALLSFFLFLKYLNAKVIDASITRQSLSLLEYFDVFTSTEQRLKQLRTNHTPQAWLHLAQLHGNKSGDVAWQLGEYFYTKKQVGSAILWYRVAIRQHNDQARIALAKLYFSQQELDKATKLLQPIIDNENALALLFEVALHQGDTDFIERYKIRLNTDTNAELYRELSNFSVFNQVILAEKTERVNLTSVCETDVQLFASSLNGLRHAQQLMLDFKYHPLASYLCLRTPKYVPATSLNCQHEANEKISCNASVWFEHKNIESRYIGVVVEQGGANVDHGIMYIDEQDNIDVLVHELSHFIGFVDEYPLPVEHQKCQKVQQMPFAHNLVVLPKYYQGNRALIRSNIIAQLPWGPLIKNTTPILSKHKKGWELITPISYQAEIGVFNARTCDKQAAFHAFKPVADRTKLAYFELPLPAQYIEIMKLSPRGYLMPSFHYNVSRDLAREGEIDKARNILQATAFD